jgi:hypothetical protein
MARSGMRRPRFGWRILFITEMFLQRLGAGVNASHPLGRNRDQRSRSCCSGCGDPYYVGRAFVGEKQLYRIAEDSRRHPDQPFAKAGAAIERIHAAEHADATSASFVATRLTGAVFDTLYEIAPERAGADCKDLNRGLSERLGRLLWRHVRGERGPSSPTALAAASVSARCS